MDDVTRRTLLAATAAGGFLAAATAGAQTGEPVPQPRRPGHGGTDPGPRNLTRDRENPDLLVPPSTDHGTLPNLRFSFSDSHVRQESGGWTRQVTQRELGISRDIAGVNMRLNAGGVRELHWHKAAEWAYMLYGTARITAVDPQGRSFVDDVGVGDLWYFAGGTPHSIQGLNPDGCEFLLVFDDGDFDEDNTFLLSDWFKHTPEEVLSKNFGVPGIGLCETCRIRASSIFFAAPVPGTAQLRQDCGRNPGVAEPQPQDAGARADQDQERNGSDYRYPACSRRPRPSRRRWWRSSPAACASCTGIPTPMNGSTISRGRRGWAYSPRQARRAPLISGRRCRLRAIRDGALYREYRNHAGALPGGVQEQLLRRRLAGPVAGADAARTGPGASESGSTDARGLPQGEVSSGPDLRRRQVSDRYRRA